MTSLILSLIAGVVVWLAGRGDPSRDPRLTVVALGLLLVAPLFPWLPKVAALPEVPAAAGEPVWGWWLGAVWLAGAVVAAGRVAVGLRRLAAWRGRSRRIGVVGLAGGRRAELRVLPGLASPAAAGILRPVVYLPPAWCGWPAAVRGAVLDHELAHLARRDPLWRLLAALACAVHWFNPLVHWLARRLECQCEFASDARVLALGHRADDYARLLCDLAAGGRVPAAALAMAGRRGLELRVRHVLTKPRPPARLLVAGLIAATVAAAAGLALLGPAEPARGGAPAVPPEEVRLRLTADPFPGNP